MVLEHNEILAAALPRFKPCAVLGRLGFTQGSVNLTNAGLEKNGCHIRSADSAARHDPNAIFGSLQQLRNPVRALQSIGFAAGGEDAVCSAGDHIFQCLIEIIGDIECTMKRDLKWPRHFNKIARARDVNGACFGQNTQDHAVDVTRLCLKNVVAHDGEFMVGVHKIAAPRTNNYEEIDTDGGANRADEARARRDTAFAERTSQLYALRPAFGCSDRRFNRIDANFQVHDECACLTQHYYYYVLWLLDVEILHVERIVFNELAA